MTVKDYLVIKKAFNYLYEIKMEAINNKEYAGALEEICDDLEKVIKKIESEE